MELSLIRDPDTRGIATLTRLLGDGGIPSALWGVNAAAHYGGGLCPLVSLITDITRIGLQKLTRLCLGYRARHQRF